MKDAAICFAGESERVESTFYGRLAANTGLLTAWARHGSGNHLHCVTPSPDEARKLLELLHRHGLDTRPLVRISAYIKTMREQNIGTLLRLDPNLTEMLWARRAGQEERSFSIVGLTHTLSPNAVIAWMGELTTAPSQPWDALICTSRAARDMVSGLFDQWHEYMVERVGATRRCPIELPVIPLGVDTAAFAHDPAARARLRARLGIGDGDAAVLFNGRLSYFEKAHPAPMFLALEMAQARTKTRLHLILAGRFPEAAHEEHYRREAAALAPSVSVHILDGGDADVYQGLRSAADVFLSLSDNVQETFGLTPVEAMAAGLPVVASDWDGYRDTIEEGVAGLRAPTVIPPPGGDIGTVHFQTRDYYRFLGRVSQRTAIDLDVTAAALAALADDPGRRRAMGRAAAERAARLYDWSVIIPQYEELWAELRRRREHGGPVATSASTLVPLAPDPFRLYRPFATGVPHAGWTIRLMPGWRDRLATVLGDELARHNAPVPHDPAALVELLATLDQPAPATLERALESQPVSLHGPLVQLYVWLMKMGVVRLLPPDGAVRLN